MLHPTDRRTWSKSSSGAGFVSFVASRILRQPAAIKASTLQEEHTFFHSTTTLSCQIRPLCAKRSQYLTDSQMSQCWLSKSAPSRAHRSLFPNIGGTHSL